MAALLQLFTVIDCNTALIEGARENQIPYFLDRCITLSKVIVIMIISDQKHITTTLIVSMIIYDDKHISQLFSL